ncbi:MAG: HTH-type transcriptional repressor KstR2 [Marmoricola sp.]|nr:HTH-type transcriptional repressor KstR2 [Marmoricola sp.]
MTGTKAARTRLRILDAAASEFAAQGYAGTSLRRIAEESGLQLGSLYFHFTSKDALLSEVVREAVAFAEERVSSALDDLPAAASARTRFSAAVRAHLRALHESSDRGAAVVRIIDLSPELTAVGAHQHVRDYARFWTGLVIEAQAAGGIPGQLDPVITRDLVVGAMHATVGRRQLPPDQVARLAETVIGLVLRQPLTNWP